MAVFHPRRVAFVFREREQRQVDQRRQRPDAERRLNVLTNLSANETALETARHARRVATMNRENQQEAERCMHGDLLEKRDEVTYEHRQTNVSSTRQETARIELLILATLSRNSIIGGGCSRVL